MLFVLEIKKELMNLEVKDCCINVELFVFIWMNGVLLFINCYFVFDV